MAIQQRLHTRLVQKLILTPSLQQAIKLLPMTTLELAEMLNQEMIENPMLEEIPVDDPQALRGSQHRAANRPDDGGVHQHDRAEQLGALGRGEEVEIAAERVSYPVHRGNGLDPLDQLFDQMRPALGRRMARVHADRIAERYGEMLLERPQHRGIARPGKAVGVREVKDPLRRTCL